MVKFNYNGNNKAVFLLLFLLCAFSESGSGLLAQAEPVINTQETISSLDDRYGTDPFQVNGTLGGGNNKQIEGHPYLETPEFYPSLLYLKDRTYTGVLINYDIRLDKAVLRHRNRFGAIEEIYLNSMDVDSFTIGERVFHHLMPEIDGGFYCTRATCGTLSFVSRFTKKISMDSYSGSGGYYFSQPAESLCIFDGNSLLKIKGWRSFRALYSRNDYNRLRDKFNRKLNFNSISDDQLLELLKFIKTIGNP